MQPITVLVVDDEPVVLDAYRHIFADRPEFTIVAEASDGHQAIAAFERTRPDVVLMDLKMPRMSGVEAMTEIHRRHPDACVVAVTTFATVEFVVPALRAGAAGYLVKDASADELVEGIHQALADEMPLSPRISRALARGIADGPAVAPPSVGLPRRVSPPTPREQEVLEHLAMGMSNRDIADRLCISEAAVKAHLRHIGDKFDVRSRTQILVLAYRYGLVDPQSPTP